MVGRVGMQDRETVGLLGITIEKRFTMVFTLASVVAGFIYTPILPSDYYLGSDLHVLSFVVVVVGGMGSLGGDVVAVFHARDIAVIRLNDRSQKHHNRIDQIIIYLLAVVILQIRPRGQMGREGVTED